MSNTFVNQDTDISANKRYHTNDFKFPETSTNN